MKNTKATANAVGSHGVSDEDAVDGAHGGDADHSEQCRLEIATEQARYAQRAEVDGVFGKVF